MVVGAWCWDGDRGSLRFTGCIGAHGAEILAEQVAARRPPGHVDAGGVAFTAEARRLVSMALPVADGAGQRANRQAAHDMRNALTTVRLRLQMLEASPALPAEVLRSAIHSIDEAAAAIARD